VGTQTSHRWIDQSTAVANQQMSFGWRHRSNQPGTGTIIQLQKSSHILQSFDGGSMWQFVFQLPSPIQIGTRYNFKPLSQRLRTDANRSGKYEWTVSLREGEFLGFRYSNPNGYPLMSDTDARASLTVLRRGIGGAFVEVDVIWPRHFVSKDQYHVHWD